MASKGTIELLLLAVSEVLHELQYQVGSGKDFLQQFGITIDGSQEAQLAMTLKSITDASINLVTNSKKLKDAMDAEDISLVIDTGKEIINEIKTEIDLLQQLKGEIISLGIPSVEVDDFPNHLLNFLLVTYLDKTPGVSPLLEFLGILQVTAFNIAADDPENPPYFIYDFRVDKLGGWLTEGSDQLRTLYGWGVDSFDGSLLFPKIEGLLSGFAIPVIYEPSPPRLDIVLADVTAKTNIDPRGIQFVLKSPSLSTTRQFAGAEWQAEAKIAADLPSNTAIIAQPSGDVQLIPPSGHQIDGSFYIKWISQPAVADGVFVVLGETGASRLEIKSVSASALIELGWDLSNNKATGNITLESLLAGGKLVINKGQGDGFIQKILPAGNFVTEFDLGLGISSDKGFYIKGSAALEIKLPVHVSLGPISVEGLTIALKLKDGKIPIELGADLKAKLGPLTAIVRNVGMRTTFSFPSDNSGNLGPLQFDIGFKPPSGVGLTIDSAGFTGGGILDFNPDNHEYFGALELEYKGVFSLKAFGIINTRMPDGSTGFSFLIIITAEFTPIQLGFGFTLMGVGGLLGLNRTVRLDVLKEGIKTNAIKSILFPEDIVANINRIVSDVKAVFPVQQDHFVVCPMGKLGWGTPAIITLELGILVEIPVAGFAILGVLKAVLPQEESALLKLQINFLGVADFDNRSFSLDGTLYDSRLLVYTLTGDMAFRLSFGDHPVFVLSVGGFHPAFKDAPADLQHMQRLAISLFNSDSAWIKVETYFAVTSNTVQFGARAELFAGSTSGFNIYGFIGYDVLFQFDPFRFLAEFSAGFALRRRTSVIMGITASGELAGPSPWDAHGKASVSFFFFSVSVSFHKTWGESVTAPEPATADLAAMLKAELMDDRNWKAEIPPNNKLHVSIKQFSSDKTIVHPFGILTFSERLLPLNIDIEKFGNKRPQDTKRFAVSTDPHLTTDEAREPFAPANFFTLSDADKLARPSYEEMISGFKITGSDAITLPLPIPISRPVDYELSYLGTKRKTLKRFGPYKFGKLSLKAGSKGGSSASSKLSVMHNRISVNAPDKVITQEDKFAIASTSDMTLYRQNLVAKSYTEALDHYKQIVKSDPALADQIQIVADYELNVN